MEVAANMRNRWQPWRIATMPLVIALFLLAQLLIGFHHHSDTEKSSDSHLPAAECTLCLAAHLPFDIAPEITVAEHGTFANQNPLPALKSVVSAPRLTRLNPRAPPLVSR